MSYESYIYGGNMTQGLDIEKKIEESLDAIYGFALKKTFSKEEAEDLSQEICLRLFQAGDKLKDIDKFNGWMWGIASNTYKEHVRKELRYKRSKGEDLDIQTSSFEEDYVEREKLRSLYREIAHLSGNHREAMTLFYMEGKSVTEISEILNVSPGMVKQYLFKSRSRVKEGISMFRENGERSFNPKKFIVHYWGNTGNYRNSIFNRKLPGNLLLEAYYEPMTVEQLTVELGVSTVYLEDEIKILMENQLMMQPVKSKYQSNIIIFTKAFEDMLKKKQEKMYRNISMEMMNFIDTNEEVIRGLDTQLSDLTSNKFRWQMASFCLLEAVINRFLDNMITSYPSLKDGEEGFVWGLEKEHGDNAFDLGIYIHPYESGDFYYGMDFDILASKNQILCYEVNRDILLKIGRDEFDNKTEFIEENISALVKAGGINRFGDVWKPEIPCYSKATYENLKGVLEPMMDKLSRECLAFLPQVEKMLMNFIPKSVTDQVSPIATLKQVENTMVLIMENLYDMSWIIEPSLESDCLTTYLVLRD